MTLAGPCREARTRGRRAAIALLALALGPGVADAAAPPPERGQALFQERCAACHSIGDGDRVGPDLAGVAARRDRAWLTRWIAAPDRVLAGRDPVATDLLQKYRGVPMPNLALGAADVEAIVAYLAAAPGGPAAAPAPGGAVAPAPGDPAAGKELFMGRRRLRNGGPPCMACHSIAGLGALGGGALGPDLTPAAAKYGDAGLASVLATVPFPTMSPIFGRQPLAPDEQADLRAFVQQAPVAGRAPGAMGRLSAFAVAGAAILFGVAHVTWRRRLHGVRAPMVARARGGSAGPFPATPGRR
jgi:mono/diheme cytochrome c family protein